VQQLTHAVSAVSGGAAAAREGSGSAGRHVTQPSAGARDGCQGPTKTVGALGPYKKKFHANNWRAGGGRGLQAHPAPRSSTVRVIAHGDHGREERVSGAWPPAHSLAPPPAATGERGSSSLELGSQAATRVRAPFSAAVRLAREVQSVRGSSARVPAVCSPPSPAPFVGCGARVAVALVPPVLACCSRAARAALLQSASAMRYRTHRIPSSVLGT
jgi:hypothetical protein